MDAINSVVGWEFLDEPLYRWAIFFVAVGAMSYAWRGITEEMRKV